MEKNYWTPKRCYEAAISYANRNEFRKKKMKTKYPKRYWTFERRKEAVEKYLTKEQLEKYPDMNLNIILKPYNLN